MKKILFISFLLLFTSGMIRSQTPTLFGSPKDMSVTLTASVYDTISIGTGVKGITVWNYTGGTLQVSFSKSDNTRDTSNYWPVVGTNGYLFPSRRNEYMYLISSATGYIRILVDYGYGENLIILPDSSGLQVTLKSKIDSLIIIDSVRAGDSVNTHNVRGYDIYNLYIRTVTDTTKDTLRLSTQTASGQLYAIGAKRLYGNIDDTTIAVNSITCYRGLSYLLFNPYPETLVIRLINNFYFTLRKVYYEIHCIRKR